MAANETITITINIQGQVAQELGKTVRLLNNFATEANRKAKKAAKSFKPLRTSLKKTTSAVRSLTGRWTAMLTTMAGTALIFKSIADAQKFGLAIAEIGTIFSGTDEELQMVEDRILSFSEALGFAETIAAKGFYQIISADITDAADAMVVLESSAKLATVGLADIKQTIDLVTSVIKAYGNEVEESARITDVLFQTVIKGKTTIPELATSLGQVLPIAATLGISLEEVSAAIATITQGGIETNTAVIQLRQAFNQLLKPSIEASAILERYNIDVSVARIRSEGFASVITELRDKLGDNAAAYSQIFGNIRALIPILALTGNQYEQFNKVLDANNEAFGRVDGSIEKLLSNPFKRFQVFFNALRLRLRQVGETFITELSNGIEARGGVEFVVDKIAVGFEALKGVAKGAAQAIGDTIDQIDAFIVSFGGIERAKELMGSLGKLVGQIGRRIVSSVVTAIQMLVQLLLRLPKIIRAVSFDFKKAINALVALQPFEQEAIDLPFPDVAFAIELDDKGFETMLADTIQSKRDKIDKLIELENVANAARIALMKDGLFTDDLASNMTFGQVERLNEFKHATAEIERTNAKLAKTEELLNALNSSAGLRDMVGPEAVFDEEFLAGVSELSKSFETANVDMEEAWNEFMNGVTLSFSERFDIVVRQIAKMGKDSLSGALKDIFRGLQADKAAEDKASELAAKVSNEFQNALSAVKITAPGGISADEENLLNDIFRIDPSRAQAIVEESLRGITGLELPQGFLFSDKGALDTYLELFVEGKEQIRDMRQEIEDTTAAQRELDKVIGGAQDKAFENSLLTKTPDEAEAFRELYKLVKAAREEALDEEDNKNSIVDIKEIIESTEKIRKLREEIVGATKADMEFRSASAGARLELFDLENAKETAEATKILKTLWVDAELARDNALKSTRLEELIEEEQLVSDMRAHVMGATEAQRQFLKATEASRAALFQLTLVGKAQEEVQMLTGLWEEAEMAKLKALREDDIAAQDPFLTRVEAMNQSIERSTAEQLADHEGLQALLAEEEKNWMAIADLVAKVRKEQSDKQGGFKNGFSAGIQDALDDFGNLGSRGTQFAEGLVAMVHDPVQQGLHAALVGREGVDAMEVFSEALRDTVATTLSEQLSQSITQLVIAPIQGILTKTIGTIGEFLFGAADKAAEELGDIGTDAAALAADEALTAATSAAAVEVGILGGQAAYAYIGLDQVGLASSFAAPSIQGMDIAAFTSIIPIEGMAGAATGAVSPIISMGFAAAKAAIALEAAAIAAAAGLANGGVMGGRPGAVVQAFASGGIPQRIENITAGGRVIKDSLYRVGEGKMKEAVVPLPGGRAIPVKMLGDGARSQQSQQITIAPQIVIQITDTDPSTFRQKLSEQSGAIQQMLAQTISQGVNRGLNQSIKKAAR